MAKTILFFTLNTKAEAVAYQRALGLLTTGTISEEECDGVEYFVNEETGEMLTKGSKHQVAMRPSRKLASMN